MMSSGNIKNRLAQERSPYLLQHSTNPVDWYPWGEEAFAKARNENKLIFLSVGYSTCHWCHVMERESFENAEIGRYLSENYVCVKVDREERPDVDRVYMNFVQATTGGGGWPMSVWLTPDLQPIVGGTYFPPDDRYYGRPGFKTILQHVLSKWEQNAEGVREQGSSILEALKKHACAEAAASAPPGEESVKLCVAQLTRGYDPVMGGFSKEPKFPQPVNFNLLFRAWSEEKGSDKGKKILEMVAHTLTKMAQGGMYDHIGKGFHRYSTDGDWHVPHFEKMLYDQAQLTLSYADMYQITKEEKYAAVVRDVLEYVSRDLSHPEGGFYSAEDADSLPTHDAIEKKEGAFCVWTKQEITSLLSKQVDGKDGVTAADVFCFHYDVKDDGNVDPHKDPHDELKSQNVLIVRGDMSKTAAHFSMTTDSVTSVLAEAAEILYARRKERPPPHLDTKMLTAWNGLMLSGYARAGQVLGEQCYTERALAAARFIREHLFNDQTGVLLRSCYVHQDGKVAQISPPISGFVDDYSNVICGLLDLFEASQQVWLLRWAVRLQDTQHELFWDQDSGGYYSNSGQDPSIIMRLKEDQDGAEPSPNSVSVHNLLRLSALLHRDEYRSHAESTLKAFGERLEKIPVALPHMVAGLTSYLRQPKQIVIVGDLTKQDTQALLRCVHSHFLPHKVLLHFNPTDVTESCSDVTQTQESRSGNEQSGSPRGGLDSKTDAEWLREHVAVLDQLTLVDGKAAAYVCENFTCSLPVTGTQELEHVLQK